MDQVCKLIKEERVCICFYFTKNAKCLKKIGNFFNIFFFFSHPQLLEMFGTGTACVVSPIERIQYLGTDLLVPTLTHEKPLFGRILDTLTAIQYGKIEHPWAVAID